jgi:cytidylate kinase
MYRAVGLLVNRSGIDLDDEADIQKILEGMDLQLLPGDGDTRVILDREDVSSAIRTAEMGMVASRVSALPVVRKKLTELQRTLGLRGAVVAEGRDTGTVVFPEAELKFYLDASPEERARRRSAQLREQGHDVDEKEILAQIKKRDKDDSARSLAPLKAAEDAVIIDSSVMTIEEVVNFMLDQLDKK